MDNKISRAVIVEDSPQMRELIRMVLGSFGASEIVEAPNGAEALASLRQGGADIVIMDWKMDTMDGLECTRRIRAGGEGVDARLPIVLLTGCTGDDARETAYAAGVDLYMEKPISLKKLYAGVSDVLNRPQ
jgi:two-component system chemotaxis response regulator CheY/two-component system phosphate regulon response regulator PhoB